MYTVYIVYIYIYIYIIYSAIFDIVLATGYIMQQPSTLRAPQLSTPASVVSPFWDHFGKWTSSLQIEAARAARRLFRR